MLTETTYSFSIYASLVHLDRLHQSSSPVLLLLAFPRCHGLYPSAAKNQLPACGLIWTPSHHIICGIVFIRYVIFTGPLVIVSSSVLSYAACLYHPTISIMLSIWLSDFDDIDDDIELDRIDHSHQQHHSRTQHTRTSKCFTPNPKSSATTWPLSKILRELSPLFYVVWFSRFEAKEMNW